MMVASDAEGQMSTSSTRKCEVRTCLGLELGSNPIPIPIPSPNRNPNPDSKPNPNSHQVATLVRSRRARPS